MGKHIHKLTKVEFRKKDGQTKGGRIDPSLLRLPRVSIKNTDKSVTVYILDHYDRIDGEVTAILKELRTVL